MFYKKIGTHRGAPKGACTLWVMLYRGRINIYKPGREVSEEINLLALWSWTSSLPNCEKVNLLFKSLSFVVFYYGSPSTAIQKGIQNGKEDINLPLFTDDVIL